VDKNGKEINRKGKKKEGQASQNSTEKRKKEGTRKKYI